MALPDECPGGAGGTALYCRGLLLSDLTVANEAPGSIKEQPLSRVRDDLESVAKEQALAPEMAASLQALVDALRRCVHDDGPSGGAGVLQVHTADF